MLLKQVGIDAFEVPLALVDAKRCACAILEPNKKMFLQQVKSDAFEALFVLVDAKRCTCATIEAKQENGIQIS